MVEVPGKVDATGKKRVVGLVLLVAILAVFLSLNRFPKLDTVREDLDAVMAPRAECFQGFCIEAEDDSTLLTRWWSFSTTYLRLVAAGMIFAFAVAGLTEGFLFPERSRRETILSWQQAQPDPEGPCYRSRHEPVLRMHRPDRRIVSKERGRH